MKITPKWLDRLRSVQGARALCWYIRPIDAPQYKRKWAYVRVGQQIK